MVKSILELSHPQAEEQTTSKKQTEKNMEYWIALLITKGHTDCVNYNMNFFHTCLKVVGEEEMKEMARSAIAIKMNKKTILEIIHGK